ncbi:MAG TPA: hypothetical protein DEO30_06115 [Lactococcus sp.]|nr:hypothetical protein [Lactococcus sp.]
MKRFSYLQATSHKPTQSVFSVKKDETARANASRLLTNANVKKYIDEQLEKILHFYHALHFSSLAYNNLLQAYIKRF